MAGRPYGYAAGTGCSCCEGVYELGASKAAPAPAAPPLAEDQLAPAGPPAPAEEMACDMRWNWLKSSWVRG